MGTFNRKPRVFISSVEKGLSNVREKICKIIEDKFKWEVWCSGHRDPFLIGTPRNICLDRVKWADLYIGIFANRYGSIVEPPGLGFTELELHHAVSNNKLIKIYLLEPFVSKVIKNPKDPKEQRFKSFIDNISSYDSSYVRNVKLPKFVYLKRKNIYKQVQIDLEDFSKWWFSPHSDEGLKNVLYIERILSDTSFLSNEIFESAGIRPISLEKRIHNENDVRETMVKMSSQYRRKLHDGYEKAVSIGYEILNNLWAVKISNRVRYLWLLADFLEMWIKSITAVGHFRGVFGGLSASICLRQIYEMLEYFPGYYGTANAISSCYYSLGYLDQSLKWNDISYFGFKNFPRREMGINSVRGRISLRKKQFKEAEKCFQNSLNINWVHGFSKESFGLHLSGLGLAEINLRKEKEGKKKLFEGERLCEEEKHLQFLVRTKRALATYFRSKRMKGEAEEKVKEALIICKMNKMNIQQKRFEDLAFQLGINPFLLK